MLCEGVILLDYVLLCERLFMFSWVAKTWWFFLLLGYGEYMNAHAILNLLAIQANQRSTNNELLASYSDSYSNSCCNSGHQVAVL